MIAAAVKSIQAIEEHNQERHVVTSISPTKNQEELSVNELLK